MAITSPAAWSRFDRAGVALDAVTGSPGVEAAPAGAFGRAAGVHTIAAGGDGGALFLAGQTPSAQVSPRAARSLFAALGVALESASSRSRVRTAAALGSRSGTTIVLQQHIDGHDVVGANVKVHFAAAGGFVMTGRPIGDLDAREPVRPPAASGEDAAAAAARTFDLDPQNVRETELQVFPTADGGARWAWRVSLLVDEPVADVRTYVAADDLSILLSFNVASALVGRARVYPVNPLRTPELREVRLADLGPTPDDLLTGARLVVNPGTPPPLARLDRDFRLTDADAGFDEANAYYHLRAALRYFGSLRGRRRFPSPPFRPIRAIVRDRRSPNNAFYLPSTGELRFGDVGPRPTARSADVLYHELTHAVTDTAAKLARGQRDSQARGLSEGYSDYFANSALDDPRFADWVQPSMARDSSDPTLAFAPGFAGAEHDTGGVWASVLWGIRSHAGRRDADRIAFESLFLLGPQSTFEDALSALLSADAELSRTGETATSHAATIRGEWDRRAPGR